MTKEDNYLHKINKEISLVQKNFFKYMIENNPNFTDLEKLEVEYKSQIKSNFDKMNETKVQIDKQKDKLKELDSIISVVMLYFIVLFYIL